MKNKTDLRSFRLEKKLLKTLSKIAEENDKKHVRVTVNKLIQISAERFVDEYQKTGKIPELNIG